MARNDFLVFDTTKTNTLTNEEYANDADRINGMQSGIARSESFNKVLGQSAVMAAALGEVVKNRGGVAEEDFATLVAALNAAFPIPVSDYGKYSQMSGGSSHVGLAGAGKIAFTTEDNDDFLAINIGASASRITIPADLNGKKAKFYWFGNGGGGLQFELSTYVQLYKNNASIQTLAFMAYRGYGSTNGMFQSTPFVLATGDYFEIHAATQSNEYDNGSSISAGSKFGIEVLG